MAAFSMLTRSWENGPFDDIVQVGSAVGDRNCDEQRSVGWLAVTTFERTEAFEPNA